MEMGVRNMSVERTHPKLGKHLSLDSQTWPWSPPTMWSPTQRWVLNHSNLSLGSQVKILDLDNDNQTNPQRQHDLIPTFSPKFSKLPKSCLWEVHTSRKLSSLWSLVFHSIGCYREKHLTLIHPTTFRVHHFSHGGESFPETSKRPFLLSEEVDQMSP